MKFLPLSLLFIVSAFYSDVYSQWNQVNCNTQFSLGFIKIDESTGTCIAGGTQFIRSSDHGITWEVIPSIDFPNLTYNKRAAIIVDPNTYVIVDRQLDNTGRIVRTTNGGINWTVSLNAAAEFTDVAYNGVTMVAVGGQGIIRVSSDGGINWTTVPSGTTNSLLTVDWVSNQNKWVIGGDSVRLTSTSATGLTWNQTSLPYIIRDLSYKNGHLLETRIKQDTNFVVQYDANMNELKTVKGIDEDLFKSHLLPNNRTLSMNYGYFYEGNLDDEVLYQTLDTLVNYSGTTGVEVTDFDIASSYGIAVGHYGGMIRFGYSIPFNLSVPADFYISANSTCPSTPIQAIPFYPQGDTYHWYINGNLVYTDDTLNIPNPPDETYIQLVVSYNGNITSEEHLTTVSTSPIFPIFQIAVDTSLCYLDSVRFDLVHPNQFVGSPFNDFYVQVKQNGVVVWGPTLLPSSQQTYNYVIVPNVYLSQSDTLILEFYKEISCGIVYQSFPYYFHVGPDLLNVTDLIVADTGVCVFDTSVDFTIDTYPGASYTIKKFTNISGQLFTNVIDNFIGDGILNINYPELYYGNENYATENTYEHNEVIVHFLTDINYNGCGVVDVPLFDLEVSNPNAYFSFENQTTFKGDTISLICDQRSDSVSWSITPQVDVMLNLHDSVPVFVSNTPGTYFITMISTNRYGCVDTITRSHVVSDTFSIENRNLCYAKKFPAMKVLGNKVSKSGDYYEYGYYNVIQYGANCNFVVRKLDSEGNLIFEKRPSHIGNNQHLVSAIAIDEFDNLYAAVHKGNSSLEIDGMVFDSSSDLNYILKWSPTGEFLDWVVTTKITDMEISNGNLICAHKQGVRVLDTNLNTLNDSFLSNFFVNWNNFSAGSFNWIWKPLPVKMKIMPNGNLAFTMSVKDPFNFSMNNGDLTYPDLLKDFSFVAIYKPFVGFVKFQKLFEFGEQVEYSEIYDIAVDDNNNIYLITNRSGMSALYSDHHHLYLDSIVIRDNDVKSFLIKLNSELEPQWIKETNILNPSLNYAPANQELFISGTIKDNFYIGNGNDFKMINGRNQGYLSQSLYKLYEPFYAILDLNGQPLKGEMLGKEGVENYNELISVISPCGDLYLSNHTTPTGFSDPIYSYSGGSNSVLDIDGATYLADSNIVFKLSASTCTDECSYVVMSQPEVLQSCGNDSVFHIEVFSINNIDSIEFVFVSANHNLSGYLQIVNASVEVSLPFENGILILHSTFFSDTITILYSPYQDPGVEDFYSVACYDNLTISIPDYFTNVFWSTESFNFLGNTIELNGSLFGPDSLFTFLVSYVDSNNCSLSTSFDLEYCIESESELGLEEQSKVIVNVFPNPTKDILSVETNTTFQHVVAEVYDLHGSLISESKFTSSEELLIGVQDLPPGFYLVHLHIDDSEHIRSFIKK